MFPKNSRSKQLYEVLLSKSAHTLRYIPDEPFDSSVSQEEYTKWLDEIITKKISEDEITFFPPINVSPKSPYYKTFEGLVSNLTDEEKQQYLQWYDEQIIRLINDEKIRFLHVKSLTKDIHYNYNNFFIEALSTNIIKAFLTKYGPQKLIDIPVPNENTVYNQDYEDIILHAISLIDSSHNDYDILQNVLKEYISDKVLIEAVKKNPRYLDYADVDSEIFDELLDLGFKNELQESNRTSLSPEKIALIKKLARGNSTLFSTLNLKFLNPEITAQLDERVIARLVNYPSVQQSILNCQKDKDKKTALSFVMSFLYDRCSYPEPLIESAANNINSFKQEANIIKPPYAPYSQTIKEISKAARNNELTDDTLSVVFYGLFIQLNNFDRYVKNNKNEDIDEFFPKAVEHKSYTAYQVLFKRFFGPYDYLYTINHLKIQPEQMLERIKNIEPRTNKEITEINVLEKYIKLYTISTELSKIREATFGVPVDKKNEA